MIDHCRARTDDQVEIAYDRYRQGHRRAVVIAPGFFNSKQSLLLQELAKELADITDGVVLDFRGHGQSGGLYHWAAKEAKDLAAVLRAIRPDYDRVAVIGFSMGAGISLRVAVESDLIHSLICVAGPSEYGKVDYQIWRLDPENDILFNLGPGGRGKGVRPGPFWQRKRQPIDLVGDLRVPVLYVHGDRDWTVRPWHSRRLYEATPGRKRMVMIPGGPHAEYLMRPGKGREIFLPAVRAWLAETLLA